MTDSIVGLIATSFAQADLSDFGARYRLLEPIRQYAHARLVASGDDSNVSDLHLGWCLDVAEDDEAAWGVEAADVMNRLERDLDNFRSALAWAVKSASPEGGQRLVHALYPLWEFRFHSREGLEWSQVLARPPTSIRSAVSRRAGMLAARLGQASPAPGSMKTPLKSPAPSVTTAGSAGLC